MKNLKKSIDWFNQKFGAFFCPTSKQGKKKQNSIYK
tara:strand:- start:924 stop:1031 length:108 start_codon:yes stop_codon:yes gene_type:complete